MPDGPVELAELERGGGVPDGSVAVYPVGVSNLDPTAPFTGAVYFFLPHGPVGPLSVALEMATRCHFDGGTPMRTVRRVAAWPSGT